MRTLNYFLFYCILSLVFCRVDVMKCGDEVIENCVKCGTGEESNTCTQCKDKHFPFFHNLFCIPCDDPLYGQVGCGGNCDATDYFQTRNIICEKDGCKEGFYNLNGFCTKCSVGAPECKRCSMTLNENNEEEFKCLECSSDCYLDPNDGRCYYYGCYSNCRKCNHTVNNGNHESICVECENGFYIDKNNNNYCKKCKDPVKIANGYCRICSDDENDYESGPCWCNTYYTLKSHSNCVKCPDNCPYCQYNKNTNKAECLRCDPGYIINSEKTCSYCGNGCNQCSLLENLTLNCSTCFSNKFESENKCLVCVDNCKLCEDSKKCLKCNQGYILLSDGTCGKCPSFCSSCSVKENDEIICLKCEDHFALKSETECVYCPNINIEGMEGCNRCGYDKINNKFECYECQKKEREHSYSLYNFYTHVINTNQCFNNSDKEKPSFYGCLTSYKNGDNYECLSCNNDYGYFINILNDKVCKKAYDINLNSYCIEAENIGQGEDGNPKYTCTKCHDWVAKINEGGRITCEYRSNELQYCLEGKYENYTYKCTKCVPNAQFNNESICECDSYSFGRYNEWCYKCDDESNGNPGCLAEKGCNYYSSNAQLNCNKCKEGYFNYTEGQCYSCSNEIYGCKKCHFDSTDNKIICDQCLEGYSYKENQCESRNCEYHYEISQGCIICEENKEEYIANKKCHKCENGFFKTKDNECVICNSENYGGTGCSECMYALDENNEETNNIICKRCSEGDNILSSDGKCFSCQRSVQNCEVCEFNKNNDDTRNIICTLCKPGFYLNTEGKCINYIKYLEIVPNCQRYTYQINNITFCIYFRDYPYYYSTYYCEYASYDQYYYFYYDDYYYTYNYEHYKGLHYNLDYNIPEINSPLKSQCIRCNAEYYLNSEGKCVKISDEDCSIISILNDFPERLSICQNYCTNSGKTKYVQATYKNNTNNGSLETLDFYEFFKNYYERNNNDKKYYYKYNKYYMGKKLFDNLDDTLKPLFAKNNLCISIPENTYNFQFCDRVQYDEKTNSYKCSRCYYDYYVLDIKNNRCKYIYDDYDDNYEDYNCNIKNIGNYTNSIYSCTEKKNDNFLLTTTENNIKYCLYKQNEEIKYCTEANINTTYINAVFDCTNCSLNFLPYYSKFFERKICQNIFDKIIKEKNISFSIFDDFDSVNMTKEGICPKNYFSPDGQKCYQCNDPNIGMPGCKGSCSFSLKRNDIIKCEGECDNGYIESREGICEKCENIVNGCSKCHYEQEYPSDYLGIKRKNRFVCDSCQSGYMASGEECLKCSNYGLGNCEECKVDPQNKDNFICKRCEKNSVFINGYCDTCDGYDVFQKGKQCYKCDDIFHGGIKECRYCEKNIDDDLICQLCNPGYILLSNDNKCLDIKEYNNTKNFSKFSSCEKLAYDDDGEIYCARCDSDYFLLKENDNDKGYCMEVSNMYDFNLDYYYYFFYHPCQEGINVGSSEQPKYSCTKCYQIFEFKKAYLEVSDYTKIVNNSNKVDYCIYHYYKDLENCTEAINKTDQNDEKYDCQKCIEDNKLVYESKEDINYCEYEYSSSSSKKCLVVDCKTCKTDNSYFCNECESTKFEVNTATGQCVKKTEIVPAVTWKDIYRLEMNGQHERNGQTFNGPSLVLRGITSSHINTRHGFLIYLTFKIKTSLLRNLEEEIKIPAMCEALDTVDETSDNLNIIDYECLANNTGNNDLTNYNLGGIEEGENSGLLKKSNLNTLTEGKTMDDFIKTDSVFTDEDLVKYVIFKMDEIQNQKAINYLFDFEIAGLLNKQIDNGKQNIELDLNEIEEKVKCDFTVENDLQAKLNCLLDINKYKNINSFSFKTSEIKTEANEIYVPKLDEVLLLNDIPNDIKKKKDKKMNIAIIIGCVIAGVVLIGVGVVLSLLLTKKRKEINNIIQINQINGKEEQNEVRRNEDENNPKTTEETLK